MKNLFRIVLLWFASSYILFAQQNDLADSTGIISNQASVSSGEMARWNVRIYPLSAITNLRAEVGFRFLETWEVNLLGAYYYNKFFWYRESSQWFGWPRFVSADGAQVLVSLEKRLANNSFSLGCRVGHRFVQGSPFEVLGSDPTQTSNVSIDQSRTDYLMLLRIKTNHKGLFAEFIAQCGVAVFDETRNFVYENARANKRNNYYWQPVISASINIGFGW